MQIRILNETDAADWWNLRREALETEPRAFGRSAEEHLAIPVEEIAARFRETDRNFTIGAFEAEALVGMASFVRETNSKEKHKGGVYGVYVAPLQRRKGIGGALIRAVLARAREDGTLEQILISVASHQTAVRNLYASFGFRTWGTEPRALKVNSEYIDEEHMVLMLR